MAIIGAIGPLLAIASIYYMIGAIGLILGAIMTIVFGIIFVARMSSTYPKKK